MVVISEENSFWGFVTVGERKYTFEILIPKKPQKSVAIFKVDWRLEKLLGSSLNEFLNENDFSDPMKFYSQFKIFVSNNLNKPKETEKWLQHPLNTSALLKSLQQEIRNTGNNVKDFDIETGLLHIEVNDAQARTHKAVLKLSQNYKIHNILVVSHDLPLQKIGISECAPGLNNIFSVTEFCENFSELVTNFQEFWNMIGLVDSQCCILDPLNPTFKDICRRIKLSETLSIALTFNPFCPRQTPNMKLLGCQSDVNYYEAVLQKNLENEIWDTEKDLMYNLSSVLEISIPNKIYVEECETMESVQSGECAICFTLSLEGEIPHEVCENFSCKSMYHSKCLFTYLSSIPRNRDYFGKIQGECPNCENMIFCTVPKLM